MRITTVSVRLATSWLAVLGFLCSAAVVRAQVAPARIGNVGGEREAVSHTAVPQQVYVTTELLRRAAYRDIHTHIARLRTLTALVSQLRAPPQVGDTQRFSVRSVLDFSKWREVTAVLLYRSPRVHPWMETHEAQALRAKQFLQPLLDSLALRLEERTPEGSFAPSQGLLALERRYLGRPPNVDGDGALDVLLLNIRDRFKETGAYVAGFFDPNDLTTRKHSNRRDLLYVDTRPTLFYDGRLHVGEAAATIAHEYQHLIHANYEGEERELTFINEGLSEWAEILCGFPPRPAHAYFRDPGRPLLSWNYEAPLPDYARASLFLNYLFEQIGPEYADALVQSPEVGLEGIRYILRQAGGPSFETLFTNWGYALFLSDRSVNPAYGYRHPARRDVRFTSAYVFDALPQARSVPLPPLSHVPLAFPLTERLTLHAQGASLEGFRPMLRTHVAVSAHALPDALHADFAYDFDSVYVRLNAPFALEAKHTRLAARLPSGRLIEGRHLAPAQAATHFPAAVSAGTVFALPLEAGPEYTVYARAAGPGAQTATETFSWKVPVPDGFELGQTYPNPTTAKARLPLFLLEDAEVSVTLYDVLGRVVRHREEQYPKGSHRLALRLRGLAAGLYFAHVEVRRARDGRTVIRTRKIMLVH